MNLAGNVFFKYLLIGILVTAGSAAANAVPICTNGSLASYIALDTGGGCTIGDITFFGFDSPNTSVTGNPPVANASQILVTPVMNSEGTGLKFSANVNGANLFSIPNPTQADSVTYYINYLVDPPVQGGADLSLDPPFGNVSATQQYCLSYVFPMCEPHGTEEQQTVSTPNPFSQILFPTPSSFIDLQTTINLSASPGNPAGFDSLTALLLPVNQVPEPASMVLAGLGLPIVFLSMFRVVRRESRLAR